MEKSQFLEAADELSPTIPLLVLCFSFPGFGFEIPTEEQQTTTREAGALCAFTRGINMPVW